MKAYSHAMLYLAGLALALMLWSLQPPAASTDARLPLGVTAPLSVHLPFVVRQFTPGTVYTVTVTNFAFSPATRNIRVGDTVRWEWAADFHTVTSGLPGVPDGLFCSPGNTNCTSSPASLAGAIYEHQFSQVGTFPYFCRFHYPLGMTGQIVVGP